MKKVSTKQKILDAAIGLLETQGIQRFSQQAVAKLVGISQGQLTYHFQKRSDLVLAVTEAALEQIAEYVWAHPDLAERSLDKLQSLVLGLMTSKTRVRALLGLVVESDESEEIRTKLIDQGHRVRSLIGAALQLEERDPEVTLAHAVMLGYAVMFFVQNDKTERAKLEKDFKAGTGILLDHLKKRRKK